MGHQFASNSVQALGIHTVNGDDDRGLSGSGLPKLTLGSLGTEKVGYECNIR